MPAKLSARLRAALLVSSALGTVIAPAAAQDATWLANPPNNNFNDSGNWTPAVVPTGTATFDASTQTSLMVTAATALGGFTFNVGAPAYGFGPFINLTFNGAGIVNNSSNAPTFSLSGGSVLTFAGASSAGNADIGSSGTVNFQNTSTAGTAHLSGGVLNVNFFNSSTAGNATVSGILGTNVQFHDNSNAGSASFNLIRSNMA